MLHNPGVLSHKRKPASVENMWKLKTCGFSSKNTPKLHTVTTVATLRPQQARPLKKEKKEKEFPLNCSDVATEIEIQIKNEVNAGRGRCSWKEKKDQTKNGCQGDVRRRHSDLLRHRKAQAARQKTNLPWKRRATGYSTQCPSRPHTHTQDPRRYHTVTLAAQQTLKRPWQDSWGSTSSFSVLSGKTLVQSCTFHAREFESRSCWERSWTWDLVHTSPVAPKFCFLFLFFLQKCDAGCATAQDETCRLRQQLRVLLKRQLMWYFYSIVVSHDCWQKCGVSVTSNIQLSVFIVLTEERQ